MPLVKGLWYRIGRKKNAFAATALIALVLATGAQAQTWTLLPIKVSPDDSWGRKYGKGPSRLVADAKGNVFLTTNDVLHIGANSALEWKIAPFRQKPFPGSDTPVSAGGNGEVIWGSWSSLDRGATWDTAGSGGRNLLATAHAIGPGGYCLFGGGYDAVERSATPRSKGMRMHMGETFGSIMDIEISPGGADAFAAPQYDELLVSRDSGRTWKEKSAVLKTDNTRTKSEELATGLLAIETGTGSESLWMAWDARRKEVMEYRWAGDSLVAFHHANANRPDSPFTVLRAQRAGRTILWLGTWGQGLFRSVDRGESWQQFNMGLVDLHVEDLAIGPDGQAYVLTRQGLFAMTVPSAILPARRAGSREGLALDRIAPSGFRSPRFGNAAGALFGADGRHVMKGGVRRPSTALPSTFR
jgi:hypothetical protein